LAPVPVQTSQVTVVAAEISTSAPANALETAAVLTVDARVAEPIVGRALLRIGKDAIGLVAFLKADLGLRIARIAVRVMLHRRLAERRL
jgi:hypothetical protein